MWASKASLIKNSPRRLFHLNFVDEVVQKAAYLYKPWDSLMRYGEIDMRYRYNLEYPQEMASFYAGFEGKQVVFHGSLWHLENQISHRRRFHISRLCQSFGKGAV